jgi:hypothetical protein
MSAVIPPTQKCPSCGRDVFLLARDPLGDHKQGVCGNCVDTRKDAF